MVCAGYHIASHLARVLHSPYKATLLVFIVSGFGHGLLDSALNTWVSARDSSTRILNSTGALYAVGAMLSPLIATIMITKMHLPCYFFIYVMVGGVTLISQCPS